MTNRKANTNNPSDGPADVMYYPLFNFISLGGLIPKYFNSTDGLPPEHNLPGYKQLLTVLFFQDRFPWLGYLKHIRDA